MTLYFGIDPGASGAIAVVDGRFDPLWIKLSETDHDVSDWLRQFDLTDCHAMIEQVGAMPKQGLSSTFKFGRSYGFLQGLLTAHRIPFRFATPKTWQRALSTLSGGNKNLTKATAQRLFPDLKITHANADALLIAEYCRRTWP